MGVHGTHNFPGIGVETVKVLAAQGAKVIIVGRDIAKANSTAEELKKVTGKDHIFYFVVYECIIIPFTLFKYIWNGVRPVVV